MASARRLCQSFMQLRPHCVVTRALHGSSRACSPMASSEPGSKTTCRQRVTMIPGDGVGPEIMGSVRECFSAAGVPVDFDELFVSEVQSQQSASLEEVTASCFKNKVCLKGIISTPLTYEGSLLRTLNMQIRRELDLFANVVRVRSLPGYTTRHNNLDFVVIREQTEGEYSALEHESVPGVVECLKIITEKNSLRIAKFAFDYATKHGRKKVTAVHKANIMKLSDGLFLESVRQVSEQYPEIEFESMIVDNCCMQMVSNPYQFDVMVMPNLYGNILDNLAAGLVGGAGVVPGESYGENVVFFEPGARHSAPAIVGKDMANPTAILLCASNMLKHMNLHFYGQVIQEAVQKVVKDGKVRTPDMGGYGTQTEFTYAVCKNIQQSLS